MSVRRIAITQRIVEAQAYAERRDAIAHDWHGWLQANFPGAVLLPLPNDPGGAAGWLDAVRPDAVILSSGNDWGEYPVRDETELGVTAHAVRAGVPLLGVCRGLQVLNVYFGGTLSDGINQRPGSERHVARNHPVELDAGWAERLKASRRIEVNSYHNWGILEPGLAKELRAFARSPDGLVEGAFHPEKPVLGIQWHPERDDPAREFDSRLITRFFEQGAFWRPA